MGDFDVLEERRLAHRAVASRVPPSQVVHEVADLHQVQVVALGHGVRRFVVLLDRRPVGRGLQLKDVLDLVG